ncbi:hypothetical protein D3C78_810550 [compost metagenome]
MIEGVTHALPALVNIEEGFDFHHGADTAVPGTLVAALEQPAIDFLTLEAAGVDHLGQRGARVPQQVAEQPQVQRVNLGDVALVRQVIFAGAVGLVHLCQTAIGEPVQGDLVFLDMRANKCIEGFLASRREQIAVYCGQALRRDAHAVEERIQALLRGFALVLPPEAHQVAGAFLVGKACQVFLAARVRIVLEQRHAVEWLLVGHVAHQVAHQANERQVDRLAQGFFEGRVAPVVLLAEVVEHVHAAAGEERFAGVGRVLALQGCVEHGIQALVLAVQRQPFQ